jgi:hypothetical protein
MEVVVTVRGPFEDPAHPELGPYIRLHVGRGWGFISVHQNGTELEKKMYRKFSVYAEV